MPNEQELLAQKITAAFGKMSRQGAVGLTDKEYDDIIAASEAARQELGETTDEVYQEMERISPHLKADNDR